MTQERHVDVLRVFTRDGEGGNHLGVVTDLSGLTDAGMQAVALELGYAETVFIDDDAPPRVRIFTPGMEMPFAGHPLVGSAWWLQVQQGRQVERVRCGVGEVKLGTLSSGGTWIEAAIDPANAVETDLARYASACRLPRPTRGWLVRFPLTYCVLEYDDLGSVATADPVPDPMLAYHGTYLVSRSATQVRARFFAPEVGIFEDAATGSAAVAYATAQVAAGEREGAVTIHQGEEMGSPSAIALSWTATHARLGGETSREESRTVSR